MRNTIRSLIARSAATRPDLSSATRALLCAAVAAGLLVGCASDPARSDQGAPSATAADKAGDRGMMSLDDEPLEADWERWTPATDAPGVPRLPARAFDYWQVADSSELEPLWSGLFSILNVLRSQELPQGSEDTIRMLMTVLEPGADEAEAGSEEPRPTRMDVTFLVDGELREGILVRVYRTLPGGATPGVSVAVWRQTGFVEPRRAQLWLHSDVTERPSVSVIIEETSHGWGMANLAGIEAHLPMGNDEADTAEAIAHILVKKVWEPLTGAGYLDPPFAWTTDAWSAPPAYPVAAGLELADRDVEQVFSDSAFPPRFTERPRR